MQERCNTEKEELLEVVVDERDIMNIDKLCRCIESNPKRSLLLIVLAFLSILHSLASFIFLHKFGLSFYTVLAAITIVCLLTTWWCRAKYLNRNVIQIDEEFLRKASGFPIQFTYKDLEIATNNFSREIGKGGFGSVFHGTLKDGRKVAVKRLNEVNQEDVQQELSAEVITLASINHANLVELYGFCAQRCHHLLVYEYMQNGCLYDWLFDQNREPLDWKTRYSIALETACGLAYLHEQSTSRILHLDVKPQNILLDENFKAKLSDFGLARLLNKDESRLVTIHVRGTPGYIAPEWLLEYGITAKSDVYSYGMVLLEIVSGRRVVDSLQDSEHWYFPCIALTKARMEKFSDLLDCRLSLSEEQAVEMKRMINLAIWCIQSNSALRPTMSTAVGILEGSLEMSDPPLDCTLPAGTSMRMDEGERQLILSRG